MTTTTTPVKIAALDVENVKRVRAVHLDVTADGLTIIGGNNAQGKTSFLDAIAWTLGGDTYRPSQPLREGAEKLRTRVELTNGIVVERRGENGSLKVTDGKGQKAGMQLLKTFISTFALDLPDFLNATPAEKAAMLLDVFPGLGEQLDALNRDAKRIYDERHALGQIAERKAKYAAELPYHADAPIDLLSGSEMTQRLQDVLRKNAENDRLRRDAEGCKLRLESARRRYDDLRAQLDAAQVALTAAQSDHERATALVGSLQDQDTSGLQRQLEEIDAINARVRQNLDKARAEAEAEDLSQQYAAKSAALDTIRANRIKLLSSVTMPLAELTIGEDGALLYRGRPWDGMSMAEQLRVGVAICSAIKPECGFVLLDGLERFDVVQLRAFAEWLNERDLQAIGTRVSTGDECSIVIDDGAVAASDGFQF